MVTPGARKLPVPHIRIRFLKGTGEASTVGTRREGGG